MGTFQWMEENANINRIFISVFLAVGIDNLPQGGIFTEMNERVQDKMSVYGR
jgi:hypothetical protein